MRANRTAIRGRSRSRGTPAKTAVSNKLAPRQLEDQLAAPAAGPIELGRVDAALEAIRRIAVQGQFAGRVADRQRLEIGRFDQDVLRGRADFGFESPHHAAEGHGAVGVGDHAHAGLQVVRLAD